MSQEELAQILREHPFTEGFRPEHIQKLASMAGRVHFAKDELIYREGDPSSFFYLLLEGKVALDVNAPGHAVRIATLSAGEELGWSSLTPEYPKHFQARTLEEVRALAFDGVRLVHACDEDCAFGYVLTRAVLKLVAQRLHATRIQLLDICTTAPGARPAHV
ncbi:MAG TPA: Crp/Fnr family transcriptional regulator [Bryobacteraceae bacterium]|nr:Crp/Fnr family transcriptional regulator [Bryobacteraceae bacterium]